MKLVLSCEHGGNKIPRPWQDCFFGAEEALASHEGFDPGALDLFQFLKPLASFSHCQEVSRLLVETNRSLGHPQLFSRFTRGLHPVQKEHILQTHYFPYRQHVEQSIESLVNSGEKVLHLSVHSFTPRLGKEIRNAEIGWLFDPSRSPEKEMAVILRETLKTIQPDLVQRFNYPYLGKADGFTTFLRRRFSRNYLGIELEVNQKRVDQDHMDLVLKQDLYRVFSSVLGFK